MSSSNWQEQLDGPKWIPLIRQTEQVMGIPSMLLCRMAYQESRFRPEIISGAVKSPAGALGILQLMPQWWSTVRVPIPFTEEDTHAQILQAGKFICQMYVKYGDWAEALAAYNFGPANEDKFLSHKITGLPKETTDYVTEILSDVPVPPGAGVPA